MKDLLFNDPNATKTVLTGSNGYLTRFGYYRISHTAETLISNGHKVDNRYLNKLKKDAKKAMKKQTASAVWPMIESSMII